MKPLSREELYELLEHHSPEEIRALHANRLDATGHAYLAEWAVDIQAGASLLTHYEREYQALDDEEDPPKPLRFLKKPKDRGASGKSRPLNVPLYALLAATTLVLVLVLPQIWQPWHPGTTRGRSMDIEQLQPINQELVDILIRRGEFLLKLGNETNNHAHYGEALVDLEQAYDLAPENKDVLRLMALVHEKLGNEKKAEFFLKKYRAL